MCPISLGTAGFRCHLYFQRILFPFVYVLCMHMQEGVFLLCLWPKKTCELYTLIPSCIGGKTWHLNISVGDINNCCKKMSPYDTFCHMYSIFCVQEDTIRWSLLWLITGYVCPTHVLVYVTISVPRSEPLASSCCTTATNVTQYSAVKHTT